MNHLCGLPNLDREGHGALSDLASGEQDVLAAFRRRHEASLCRCDGWNYDDVEEEKKSSSPVPPSFATPRYEIDNNQLPPSGLRPLDDATLYRFLLADRRPDGTFDSEASFRRLRAALEFRKERKVDDIVRRIVNSTIPPDIQKSRRLRVAIWAGFDLEMRPVLFERLGQFFGSGNVSQLSLEEWTTSWLYFLETHFYKMRESAQRSGKRVDRFVYCADLQGVVSSILNRKIWKVVPLLKHLVKTVECHYPEIVAHVMLFNVPR